MKKILDLITDEVTKAFTECGYDAKYAKVTLSNRPDLCEYQCNGAMAAAKEYKKAPFMIADEVVEKLAANPIFAMAESVKPGFLNLKIDEAYLADYVAKMQEDEGRFGCEKTEAPKTIMIDYGGIFGALWEMAEASGVGLEIDLKKIPIRQETVEVCEFFGVNPYLLISSGCMLMAAQDGNHLVRELEKAGIKATIIGKATAGNDRVLLNEDERRFLEPPKTDELYKVIGR